MNEATPIQGTGLIAFDIAAELRTLSTALAAGAVTPTPFKQCLRRFAEASNSAFQQNVEAVELMRVRADLLDQLLIMIWRHYLGEAADQLTLTAAGGYGRRELHPGSDVDILILIPETNHSWSQRIEGFIQFLWDIGLDLGQSVRTPDECVQEAIKDVTVITNLMEARLLIGPEHLFSQMKAATSPANLWSAKDFFEAKWNEQKARHARFHDTGYQLEPNIKESPGGLRDIQVVTWVAKRHFDAHTLEDLASHHFLTDQEYRTLASSQRFLWKVRYALHMLAGRREDRLLFDFQVRLAALLGYVDKDNQNLAVEQFMQVYYVTIKRVSRLNEMLLQLFRENILYPHDETPPEPINARFQNRHGYIEVTHDKVFERYPFALLEIFLLLEQHAELQGVRASTIRLIRQYRNCIDDGFRADIRARSLFMEILRQPRGITHEFRRMNRYGILARYIPAFGHIVGRMQFDLFHVYTVDEHILFVLRNLRRLTVPKFNHEYPFCSELMTRIPKQEILYLGAIFHDVAKGCGGDHSELGETMADTFCRQHGLSVRDTSLVSWLVRKHLLMSITAQRKDISDPSVIHDFAAEVRSQTRLDYLFLLTVADMRGTNPNLLTTWKYSLLVELYRATRRALERGLDNPMDVAEIIAENRDEAKAILAKSGCTKGVEEATWSNFPPEYFVRHHGEEIAWETRLILENTHPNRPLVSVRSDPIRGGTAIFIYTPDRNYLFGLVSATLIQLGLTVQDARIHSTPNGYALDTYMVLEENGSPITDPGRPEEIEASLRSALSSTELTPPKVNRRIPRAMKSFQTPTQISFINDANAPRTRMELVASDRPGLLAIIGCVFQEQHISLHTAKIATIGERVEDTFFITDAAGRLDNIHRQQALAKAVTDALATG